MLKSTLAMLAVLSSVPMQLAGNPPPRVNMPYFGAEAVGEHASAIFWYGQVTPTHNYTDIRIGYNDAELLVRAQIFDRRIWHSEQAAPNDDAALSQWDAVTVYLDQRSGGEQPSASSYRFTVQLNWPGREADYRSVSQGDGSGYSPISAPITSTTVWRGDGPNNEIDDRGWFADIHIPFTRLGLSRTPVQGTLWRMAMQTHDRDGSNDGDLEHTGWPNLMDPLKPSTWAELHFGLPEPTSAAYNNPISITLRQGLNGVSVSDASVGGGTTCADGHDYFAEFGTLTHTREEHANVQNQSDVADWPCFSKFYMAFPLTSLLAQQVVVSATLTLNQFGNSGQGVPPEPISSLIQAIAVDADWQEDTLNWNNAPQAQENISMARALPMAAPQANQPVSSAAVRWDVTRAAQQAYAKGAPLRLALYSADEAQNSGKYFWTSDVAEGLADLRPTLAITLGQPVDLSTLVLRAYLPILRRD